jgi:UDP-3-O-[3-hydroxymyristoyl] glucosamine N-acyltransferase
VTVTLRHLAALVQGQLHGDGDLPIASARPLHAAQAGDISFVENAEHAHHLERCQATALVVPLSFVDNGRPLIQVADPLAAFVAIYRHLRGLAAEVQPGIDPRALVHPTVQMGRDVHIGPLATVGEGTILGDRCQLHAGVVLGRRCRLGADVVLYPHVVLYDGMILGDRVVIHANSVVGAEGFGYRLQDGRHVKVPQLSHVEIGSDVEIGAGTTIDRGTFEPTQIGQGTKIDNQVQIAHNCRIGRYNLLCAQVGMAGSSSTGDYVILAGQVGVADHIHIGTGAVVGAKSGVSKNARPGERLFGIPAFPAYDHKRALISMAKLPELRRDVRRIKQQLGLANEDE